MTTPLVSIIVPVYNDGAFLIQGLESIANQTFDDFEVVISDDCSMDSSGAIAAEFARRDSRFRLVTNPSNLGMTRNWNRALQEALGTYVIKLDADDFMRPHCLEVLAAELEGNPEIHTVYCRTLDCSEQLEPYSSYLGDTAFYAAGLDPLARHVRSGHDWYAMCFSDVQLWHSNAQMHRRASLLHLGGWDETWGCASDTDLILRVLETGNNVCHNPYAGILYRHRSNSVSDTFRRQGWLRWESVLIHLSSLSRHHDRGNAMIRTLRKEWWRYWQNWKAMRDNEAALLAGFPEVTRSNLATAAAAIRPPPMEILLRGLVRLQLHNLLRLAAGPPSSSGNRHPGRSPAR